MHIVAGPAAYCAGAGYLSHGPSNKLQITKIKSLHRRLNTWLSSPSSYINIWPSHRLALAFSVTFSMFVVELLGGIISNSLSLIVDARHMVVDSFSLVFGLITSRQALSPATKRRAFGYLRLERLAAFLMVHCCLWSRYVSLRPTPV
ncbi:MAG: cation transporter [Candidatus Hadarchaeaceae archaeon]